MLSMMRPQLLHCLTSLAPKADARESPAFYDLELESEPVTTLGLTSKAMFYRTMPKVGLRAAPMVLACRSLNTAASSRTSDQCGLGRQGLKNPARRTLRKGS